MRRTHSWVRRFGCRLTELVIPTGGERWDADFAKKNAGQCSQD
jgi:hypothetical protein